MVKTVEELLILCNIESQITLACSIRAYDGKSCLIMMVEDEAMRKRGWTTGLLLRHEMGHCNGWTQAHEGQRSVYSGATHFGCLRPSASGFPPIDGGGSWQNNGITSAPSPKMILVLQPLSQDKIIFVNE